jgi:hypothetical protein
MYTSGQIIGGDIGSGEGLRKHRIMIRRHRPAIRARGEGIRRRRMMIRRRRPAIRARGEGLLIGSGEGVRKRRIMIRRRRPAIRARGEGLLIGAAGEGIRRRRMMIRRRRPAIRARGMVTGGVKHNPWMVFLAKFRRENRGRYDAQSMLIQASKEYRKLKGMGLIRRRRPSMMLKKKVIYI